MAHVVVLGAGSMPAAYALRAELGKEHRITVINEQDYFQFVPSNPWLAVGWRDRASITFDIRPHLEGKGVDFIAEQSYKDYLAFLDDRGHVVIGAMPFASCCGTAYEYAFILDADLRKRKKRDKVPMTCVTSEPYIGHLGLKVEGLCNPRGFVFVDDHQRNPTYRDTGVPAPADRLARGCALACCAGSRLARSEPLGCPARPRAAGGLGSPRAASIC